MVFLGKMSHSPLHPPLTKLVQKRYVLWGGILFTNPKMINAILLTNLTNIVQERCVLWGGILFTYPTMINEILVTNLNNIVQEWCVLWGGILFTYPTMMMYAIIINNLHNNIVIPFSSNVNVNSFSLYNWHFFLKSWILFFKLDILHNDFFFQCNVKYVHYFVNFYKPKT